MQVRNKDRVDSQLLKIQGYLKPGNQFLIKYHANKHNKHNLDLVANMI